MTSTNMLKLKNLPRDISTFSTMITGNYLYVDKTKHIYELYSTGDRYHFLSRPRRFGKSLLISTLKELFLGNKKLFEGLWISSSDYIWSEHPVIHLDFSTIAHRTPEHLELSLNRRLDKIAEEYNIVLKDTLLEDKIDTLVKELSKNNKVVLLVDEYDHPLLKHLNNLPVAEANREILKSFYDGIKGLDAYFHAIFITGVTKFSKTSIFSGINNLNDISLAPKASTLLGYTQDEIHTYFTPYLENFAQQKNKSVEEITQEMRAWYNGYRFSELKNKVYNPFSVTYYLKDQKQENYWFESGTPTFLVNLLKTQFESLEHIQNIELSRESLGTFELNDIPIIAILFQTGYLTIMDYNAQTKKFKLNYPNTEVEESFKKYLIVALARTNTLTVDRSISQLTKALQTNDIAALCATLQILFAHIPYQLPTDEERYYHSLFQLLGALLPVEVCSEIPTDKGRIDLVINTKLYVYITELKFNVDAKIALKQIDDRKYYERYLNKDKQIVLVGISFNRKKGPLTIDYSTRSLNT